jgi:hypothetical protein
MRASIYNNPLFADGLAGIIENYMGNPDRERAIARDELDMQRGQLDLENQRLQNDALRQRMAMAGRGGGGGGSGGVDPARLGALFAQLGQTQGASPYSTGTPVTADFIAPSQPLSFGEAMPAAMPQAMPAPPSPMAEGLSFGEIVTEPPAPVDRHEQIGRLLMEAEANPLSYIDPTQKAYFKALEAMYERTAPEEVNPMDALDLQHRQLQIRQMEQDLAGGGASSFDGLSVAGQVTLRNALGDDPTVMGQALDIINQGIMDGDFANETEALGYVLQSIERQPEVIDPAGTGLSRLFGAEQWFGAGDAERTQPDPEGKITGIRPLLDVGQPGAQAGGPVQITTDEEFDALPSGTQFLAPDGTLRVKP